MNTAKIFINGRSQAIRLPKEYRFNGKEVYINKIHDIIILLPKDNPWESFINSLDQFSVDFMSQRDQLTNEQRAILS